MMRPLNEQDMEREANDLFDTVTREREERQAMECERRDGLYYDDEPVRRKLNPWVTAAVIGSICLGLAAGILWREMTKQ